MLHGIMGTIEYIRQYKYRTISKSNMKDLLRRKTSLTEEIETALNEQIMREAHSSAVYLAMGSWCDQHGFEHKDECYLEQIQIKIAAATLKNFFWNRNV